MQMAYNFASNGSLTKIAANADEGRVRMLNRPFRSVAELGVVSRGIAWRKVDFAHRTSLDGGLLEVFCIYDDEEFGGVDSAVVAGRVNINTASSEVIAALLARTQRRGMGAADEADAWLTDEADIRNLADAIVAWRGERGNFRSRADLVGRMNSGGGFEGLIDTLYDPTGPVVADVTEPGLKMRRETVIRAMSDATTTRTWNMMIDLVAQSGRLVPNAVTLEDFARLAERRYWVFLSVDRLTGEILEMEWELVTQ
jgi:hypothetical protein